MSEPPSPTLMYGTAWKEERTEALTREALRAGFRAIDTANQRKHYFEAGVGAALLGAYEAGEVTREALFLQTKYTYQRGQDQRLPYDPKARLRDQVRQSVRSSLEHLHTDRLDALLLHGPFDGLGWSMQDREVWQAMEALVGEGVVAQIGVSNMSLGHMEQLLKEAKVRPSFLQNRCYADSGWDREVRALCAKAGVRYQGFSLLTANRPHLERGAVPELAARHGATVAQVVFAACLRMGMIVLTGTGDPKHMREDLLAPRIELSDEEVRAVETCALRR